MNSYIEIKKEIENLEQRLKNKNDERNQLILPMIKIIEDNSLNNVMPSNLDNYIPKNLPLRLTILAEEVELHNLSDKVTILGQIENTKRKIIEKNNEEIVEIQRIDAMKIKLEERKKYVLSRIPELNQINKQIELLQSGINRRLKILNEGSLEKEEQRVIRNIIDKNIEQIKSLESQKSLIMNEKGLYSDIKQIEKEDNLIKKEDKEIKTAEEKQDKKEQTPDNEFIENITSINNSINEIEDKLNKKLPKDNTHLIEEFNKETKKIDLPILPKKEEIVEKKQVEANTPISFEIEEIPDQTQEKEEHLELTETPSEEMTVVETHSNFLLETKLKLKKGLRIILGLKNITTQKLLELKLKEEKKNTNIGDTISNLIGGIIKTPEGKVVDKARENIESAKILLEDNNLSNEEQDKIKEYLSKVYLKLNQARNDKTHQRYDSYYQHIAELENISDQLQDKITMQYEKVKTR